MMKLSNYSKEISIDKILGHYYKQIVVVQMKDKAYAELHLQAQKIYICDGIFPFVRTRNLNTDITDKMVIWAERLINNDNAKIYEIENHFPNDVLEDVFTKEHINYLKNIGVEI